MLNNLRIGAKHVLSCTFLIATVAACSDDAEQQTMLGKDPAWKRGRAVYMANCIACHNTDPSKEGTIGPAVKGSPEKLLEARLLRSDYPFDYKPKRKSKVMPIFPFLKPEIPYLEAFLR